MNKIFIKDAVGWGLLLWAIGYVLGIVFFMFVPQPLIGWIILPIGTIITLWVLFNKISGTTIQYYVKLAIIWALIAIICDYFFLVSVFKPADGYYKLDVYVYYMLTFLLPIFVYWRKEMK